MSLMQFLSKITPSPIKNKIKAYVLANNVPTTNSSVKKMAEEIAEREIASFRATSSSPLKYEGRVYAVIGGYGYIGMEVCRRLTRQGAIVCICSRDGEKGENAVHLLTEEGGNAEFVPLDVTNEASVASAFQTIVDKHGRLDGMIDCAGGSARQDAHKIAEQSFEVIDRVISTNLNGMILTDQYAARIMIPQGHGRIVNLSSTIGVGGKSGYSEYACAKAGVIGFSRSLALELGEHGITVNCVTPGIVERGDITEKNISRLSKTNAMHSAGIANDIAYGVDFFLSDEANFITGHNLIIDGGRSLGLKGD